MGSLSFVILVFVVIYLLTKNKYLSDTIKRYDSRLDILNDRYMILERVLFNLNPKAMKNWKYDPDDEEEDSTPEGEEPDTPPGGGGGQ